ncbi:hypothetical protein VaNZ11_006670 [Volvox africanus]|uniref:Integrase catalytic domain-containing protein n=1 Tax=Volvox africanus TaxID=51714 RepID=A0ABQ5S1W7_9CHLO|nr:hypothetical protein VaNZ11_006670 [Volvox africanus]
MAKDTKNFVQHCSECQCNKSGSSKGPGLLQPLQISAVPWESVSLDFVIALPKTEGEYDAFLVMVDCLTKMVHFPPTTSSCTAELAAHLFFDIIRLHGVPRNIVLDCGPQFGAEFCGVLGNTLQMRVNVSMAYHLQADGQTEHMNRTLGDAQRNYSGCNPMGWDTYLSATEFVLNNTVNRSTGQSPFFLSYGFHPVLPVWRELDIPVPAAVQFAKLLVSCIPEAKACLDAA